MKLSVKIGGMCGSAVFIITALPGLYQHLLPSNLSQMAVESLPSMDILETLMISFGGAVGVGMMGYTIGDILSNPKGRKKRPKPSASKSATVTLPSAITDNSVYLLTTQEVSSAETGVPGENPTRLVEPMAPITTSEGPDSL